MKVGLIVMGRLENRYAEEFIEHYKKLGFDHIFIIDNNHDGEEYFEDVLQIYINSNYVSIYDYRNKIGIQNNAYKELYYKVGNDYDWLFFCDFDEFLILNKDDNIKQYLSRNCFKNYNQIFINWKIYTDNNLIYDDGRSCMERFTEPLQEDTIIEFEDHPENEIIKSIIRTKLTNLEILCPHYFLNDLLNISTCNNIGESVTLIIFQKINYDLAYIKHFTTKTIEEWTFNKYVRGTGARDKESFKIKYPFNRFFKYNKVTKEKLDYLKEHNINIDIEQLI